MKIDQNNCTGCGRCMDECQLEAIEGRNYTMSINESLCIDCGNCADICDDGAII